MIAYSQRGADEYRRMGFPAGAGLRGAQRSRPAADSPRRRRARQSSADRPLVLFVGRLQSAQAHRQPAAGLRGAAGRAAARACRSSATARPARSWRRWRSSVYPQAEFSGARYGDELAAAFARADLFVLPGTGGLAVQQAMSFGLPVIVAEGDGTQDDLVRPGNGWHIPAGRSRSPESRPAGCAGRRRRACAGWARNLTASWPRKPTWSGWCRSSLTRLAAIAAQVTAGNSRPSG